MNKKELGKKMEEMRKSMNKCREKVIEKRNIDFTNTHPELDRLVESPYTWEQLKRKLNEETK